MDKKESAATQSPRRGQRTTTAATRRNAVTARETRRTKYNIFYSVPMINEASEPLPRDEVPFNNTMLHDAPPSEPFQEGPIDRNWLVYSMLQRCIPRDESSHHMLCRLLEFYESPARFPDEPGCSDRDQGDAINDWLLHWFLQQFMPYDEESQHMLHQLHMINNKNQDHHNNIYNGRVGRVNQNHYNNDYNVRVDSNTVNALLEFKEKLDRVAENMDECVRKHNNRNDGAVLFGSEFVLCEALPYLDTVSIVDKKIVCRRWKDECEDAIKKKGRRRKKRFVNKAELRNAVQRYCRGNRDDIENIAEEYGYPIGKWDVSRVGDFSRVFKNLKSFDEDIGGWCVVSATNMREMFAHAESFNQNLSGWNVSMVENMRGMFSHARVFDGDVSTWDTSGVTDMSEMFMCAERFNGNLADWDTSRVGDMSRMFHNALEFNRNVAAWDTSRVRRASYMFYCENVFIRWQKTDFALFGGSLFVAYILYDRFQERTYTADWEYTNVDYVCMVIICASLWSKIVEAIRGVLDMVPLSLKPRTLW